MKSRPRHKKGSGITVFGESKRPSTLFSRTSQTTDREFVRLRYAEPLYDLGNIGSITSPTVEKYALNAVYDPYLGVGGGQPGGLARMFAMYAFCRVWGSRIRVTATRSEHGNDIPYILVVVPISWAATTSPPTILSTYIEQPYARKKTGGSAFSDKCTTITHKMRTPKISGLSASGLMESAWAHNSTANTFYLNQWHIVLATEALVTAGIALSVEMVFDCEFYGRLAQPTAYFFDFHAAAVAAGMEQEVKRYLGVKSIKSSRSKDSAVLPVTESKEELVLVDHNIITPSQPKLTLSTAPTITGIHATAPIKKSSVKK